MITNKSKFRFDNEKAIPQDICLNPHHTSVASNCETSETGIGMKQPQRFATQVCAIVAVNQNDN